MSGILDHQHKKKVPNTWQIQYMATEEWQMIYNNLVTQNNLSDKYSHSSQKATPQMVDIHR